MNQRIENNRSRIQELKKYVKLEAIAYLSRVNKNTMRNALYNGSPLSQEKLIEIQRAIDILEQLFK